MAISDSVVVIDLAARFNDQTQPGLGSAQKNVDRFTESINKEKKQAESFNKTKAQVRLEAKDQASKILTDVSDKARSFSGKTYSATMKIVDMATKPLRSIYNFATSIQGVVTGIATGYAVDKLVKSPLQLADNLTSAQIGFSTMLGSAKAGQKMISGIQKFAIATPFSTSEVIQNTQTMMAYGFQAKDVIKDMQIIGDQAAATGKGSEGLQNIALALGQMQAHGKVDAQDMNQLTSAGVKGWDYLAAAMHKTKGEVMELAENPKKGGISSDFGVQAILNGMKEYNGMMDKTANLTASGLGSQIKDTFDINILTKWGQGLQKGVVGSLSSFNDWLGKNQGKIAKWGDALEGIGATISHDITDKIETLSDRVSGAVNSSDFKKAVTVGDKIHVLWDKVIADPFDKWWNSSGKKWMAEKAGKIGEGLGSGLSHGLLALLGIQPAGAASDGESIAGSFANGFSKGFNGKKIAELFVKDFKSIFKDAATLLPGGKKASSTSGFSALLLSYLGIKGIKAGYSTVKGTKSVAENIGWFSRAFKKLFGKESESSLKDTAPASAALGDITTGTMNVRASVVNVSGPSTSDFSSEARTASEAASTGAATGEIARVGGTVSGSQKLLGVGEKLTVSGASKLGKATDFSFLDGVFADAGKVGKFAEIAGKAGKTIPILGTAVALAGGAAEVATAAKGKKVRTAMGFGGNLAGGFAGATAGAQLGAMAGGAIGSVVPGAGNAVGAAIGGAVGGIGGGIAGAIGGEKATKALYDNRNSVKKGLSAAGKTVGNFFTQTLPGTAEKAASSTGGFITKTIPGTFEKLKGNIDKFYAKLPHETGLMVGRAAGSVEKTAVTNGTRLGNAASGFFGKTLPGAASKVGTSAGNFVTKTVPGAAQKAGSAVGNFFTKTLPDDATKVKNSVGNFVTKTIPGAAESAGSKVGAFFTKTLPDAAGKVKSGAGTFITKILPGAISAIGSSIGNFFTKTIPDAVGGALSSAQKFFGNAGKGIEKAWNGFTSGVAQGYNQTSAHATGGFFGQPHIGLIAEDGPEAIIPLSGSKKSRGLSLWQQAGRMLGVTPYANGGIIGSGNAQTSAHTSNPPVQITIQKIEITGTSSSTAKEIVDDLAYELGKRLEKVFSNMPAAAGG